MPIVSMRDLLSSIFHGCIVTPMWNAHPLRFAQIDHAFVTKKLWARDPAPRFLRPCFFGVPALGPRKHA
jgi:hypothetical protein